MIEPKGEKVEFRVHCPDADEVHLAGDFNGWSIPGIPMKATANGWWHIEHHLPHGPQRVGYFALRWRKTAGTHAHPHQMIDASWLTEYETICVDEPALAGPTA